MDTRSCTIDQRLPVRFTQNELYLMFTDTSEPAADVRRTSRGYAPLFGIHEHERPVIAWSSRLRNRRSTFSNRRCFYKQTANLSFKQLHSQLKYMRPVFP